MVDKTDTTETGTAELDSEFEEFVEDGRTIKRLVKPESKQEQTQDTTIEATEGAESEGKPDENTAPDLPAKFKGKSVDEIINMYSNLEKKLGEQGTELGELRRYAKELIASDFKKGNTAEPQVPRPDEFYEDAPGYVNKVVESKATKIEQELTELKRTQAFNEFKAKHPDYAKVGQSEGFREWVASKPYRMEKFARADAGDVMLADELLSDYKDFELIRSAQAKREENNQLEVDQAIERKAKLKKLSGESGKSPMTTKKKYRAVDLIRLREKNPDLYEQMGDEILAAYAEGRVK